MPAIAERGREIGERLALERGKDLGRARRAAAVDAHEVVRRRDLLDYERVVADLLFDERYHNALPRVGDEISSTQPPRHFSFFGGACFFGGS